MAHSPPLEAILQDENFLKRMQEAARRNIVNDVDTSFTVFYSPPEEDVRGPVGGTVYVTPIVVGDTAHRQSPSYHDAYSSHPEFREQVDKFDLDKEHFNFFRDLTAQVRFHQRSGLRNLFRKLRYGGQFGEIDTETQIAVPNSRDLEDLNYSRNRNFSINPTCIIGAVGLKSDDGSAPVYFTAWREKTKEPLNIANYLRMLSIGRGTSEIAPDAYFQRHYSISKGKLFDLPRP